MTKETIVAIMGETIAANTEETNHAVEACRKQRVLVRGGNRTEDDCCILEAIFGRRLYNRETTDLAGSDRWEY